MIPNGLFTQVIIVVLSIGIIFTYLKPEFSKIGETQNKITTYQEENQKVKEVNDELERQVGILKSVSKDDNLRLLTYLPDYIDPIVVMKDIQAIAKDSGVILSSVTDLGEGEGSDTQNQTLYFAETFDPNPVPLILEKKPSVHTFGMSFEGSYSQVKDLLQKLEQNHYPLVVDGLEIQTDEGGFLGVTATINTYAFINEADTIPIDPTLENIYGQ